jgi:type I restriction enzyme S subunit
MRAYFHRVNFAPFKGVTRTTVFVLRPHKRTHLSFALFLLNMDSSVHYANLHSKGSTMPYAVWNNSLSEMPVALPPDEFLERFHVLIYPFLQIISGASEENIKLTQLRDSLLPRLISGKIRVRI